MRNLPATEIIQTCMNLGLFVSINQRLDAETMSMVADEFEYTVEFVSVDVIESIKNIPSHKLITFHNSPHSPRLPI